MWSWAPRRTCGNHSLRAVDANWLVPPPALPFEGMVQIRYNSPATPATITPQDDRAFEVRL